MKTRLLIIVIFLITGAGLFNCKDGKKTSDQNSLNSIATKQEWAIVIHGGAGVITREKMTPEMDKEYRKHSEWR